MRYLSRLKTDLLECAREGLLSTEQAERIAERIRERRDGRGFGARWIAIIAGLCIAAGVSLIIAHNWERIPGTVKIASYICALTAVGAAAVHWRDRPASLPLQIVWLFFPLLGIGLYAQVFQLSGDPVRPFLVWLVLTLPLAAGGGGAVATLHAAGILGCLWTAPFEHHTMLSILQPPSPTMSVLRVNLPACLMIAALLAVLIWETLTRLPRRAQTIALGAALGWTLRLFADAQSPLEIRGNGWLFTLAAALTILWVVVGTEIDPGKRVSRWTMLGWVALVYGATFLWHSIAPLKWDGRAAPVAACALFSGAAVFSAAVIFGRRLPDPWKTAARALLVSPLALAFLLAAPSAVMPKVVAVAANAILFGAAVALMWYGATQGEPRLVNWGVSLATLLLVTRFVDVFGTYMRSGFAFIVTGLALAGLSWLLMRGRRAMLEAAAEKRA